MKPQAIEFLAQLRENNNRDWFAPRKTFYETELKAPMDVIARTAALECQKKGLALFAKEPSPVGRIYRDTRFSADKRPYQHHTGATLLGRSGSAPLGELYLHVSPEASFVAAGFYMPDAALVRAWRNRMVEQPAGFESVAQALRKKRLEFSTEWQLKRMPRGFERAEGSAVAPYLKLKCLVVSRPLTTEVVTSPGLVKAVVQLAMDARPLLEWGWTLGYKPTARRESDLA